MGRWDRGGNEQKLGTNSQDTLTRRVYVGGMTLIVALIIIALATQAIAWLLWRELAR